MWLAADMGLLELRDIVKMADFHLLYTSETWSSVFVFLNLEYNAVSDKNKFSPKAYTLFLYTLLSRPPLCALSVMHESKCAIKTPLCLWHVC